MQVKIGIIGGSGFYQIEGLSEIENIDIDTPFGPPSDTLIYGKLDEQALVFLPRHGVGHPLLPSDINVRANIYALKTLGVEWVISVSAVGSLKQAIEPRHFVVPDQLYDHTKNRISTFFGDGIAAHISMAHPFCSLLSTLLYSAAIEIGATVHNGGTYLCMEGPGFSTQAESNVYRQLGFDIIGMTAAPEAKLAREAEMCYAILACATDYDCWHPDHDNVTTEMILDNLRSNVELSKQIVKNLVSKISTVKRECTCVNALQYAIATQPDKIPITKRHELKLLLDKYLV